MLWWSKPREDRIDAAFAALGGAGGVPAAVLLLARDLQRPADPARSLRLAAVAPLTPGEAAALGSDIAALAAELAGGGTREALFVRALGALDRQRRRNRCDPRLWPLPERRRLFDPDALVRPCAHDAVLARLSDRVWREAAGVLRGAGCDLARLALGARAEEALAARRVEGARDCG